MKTHTTVFARALAHSGDGLDLHLAFSDDERMAHGYEVAGPFGRHDSGHARAGEYVALLCAVLEHHGLGLRMHEDAALRHGDAAGHGLIAHIDHADVTGLVNVRQLVTICIAGIVLSHVRSP